MSMIIEILSNINPLSVLFWCVPFALIIVVNELLDKHTEWPREFHRKFGHILSGIAIVCSTYFLNQSEMVLFGICLILGAIGTRFLKFNSIHEIARKSFGTTLFPIAVIVMTVIWFNSNPELVRYGVLILTVPDALAAIIGSQYGKQIPGFNKSFLGSAVFFIATVLVTLLFTQVWWVIILTALVLTIIEFLSQWGIDNFLLPLTGGYLLLILI